MREIINKVFAELAKFKRVKWFYILSFIYMFIVFILFFQRALNPNSGYYFPEMSSPDRMISFNILFLIIAGVIWGAPVGAFAGGSEYHFKTWCINIGQNGRIKAIIYKLAAICIMSFVSVIVAAIMGMILPVIFNIGKTQSFCRIIYVYQVGVSFFIMLFYTIMGFGFAFLLKSQKAGTILGIIMYFLPSYLNGFIQGVGHLSISRHVTLLSSTAFKNMEDDPQITTSVILNISPITSFMVLLCIMTVIMVITCIVSVRREYAN